MGESDIHETVPGWHADPRARFELRYHNGRNWTADVATDGDRFVDPLGTRPQPPGTHQHSHQQPGRYPQPSNRVATASMILGIVAICIGWMPFVVALGLLAAVLALVFGIVGRRQAAAGATGAGFARTGLITGAIGLLVCVGGVVFSVSLLRAVDRFEQPAEHETSITSCTLDGNDLTATGTLANLSDSSDSFTVRVYFVRPGTDNPRRQATIVLPNVPAGQSADFEATRTIGDLDLDCIVGAVRGPLPYGVDPGT